MTARISYTLPTSPPITKNIDLDKPDAIYIDPFVPRNSNTTLTGDTEIIVVPRVDVHVQAHFSTSTDLSLRAAIHRWWQWAQKGNQFRFVFDTTKTVKTTLFNAELQGQTVITVRSATIVDGQRYVMIDGPNYQLVTVSSAGAPYLSGGFLVRDITIDSALDADFASGAVWRDEYLWDAVIRDPNQHTPINDKFDPEMWGSWDFSLDFFEDVA